MATQPPFLSKIAMNDHFQKYRRLTLMNFWPRNGLHHKSKNVIYGKETYVGWGVRASGRRSMATQPPFLSKIAMNDHFQWHWRLTTTDFLPINGLHHKSKNLIYDNETYVGWGVWASGRWWMATQPPFFVENSHEWTFSIIPKVNTYVFFPKKSSPPEIQECDLWQRNICGVRCTSLWSMINGHTTPIFVENSHERQFPIIPKANTYRFLTKKWSPLEIPKCDLWRGNICGVRCTSL
jgi:hypothetical protein